MILCCIDEHLCSNKRNHWKIDDGRLLLKYRKMNKAMASLFISSKGEIHVSLKRGPVLCSLNFKLRKGMILITFCFCSLLLVLALVPVKRASRHASWFWTVLKLLDRGCGSGKCICSTENRPRFKMLQYASCCYKADIFRWPTWTHQL